MPQVFPRLRHQFSLFSLLLPARNVSVIALFRCVGLAHALILFCVGGPGTGKTFILQKTVELQERFFPASTQRVAFMNSASRLLVAGKTLHSAFALPRGNWTPSNRTLGHEKERLLAEWRLFRLLCVDEVSMIAADIFYRCHFRAQQLKQCPTEPWGNLIPVFSQATFCSCLEPLHSSLPPLPPDPPPCSHSGSFSPRCWALERIPYGYATWYFGSFSLGFSKVQACAAK